MHLYPNFKNIVLRDAKYSKFIIEVADCYNDSIGSLKLSTAASLAAIFDKPFDIDEDSKAILNDLGDQLDTKK